jgi:hypothetical protein
VNLFVAVCTVFTPQRTRPRERGDRDQFFMFIIGVTPRALGNQEIYNIRFKTMDCFDAGLYCTVLRVLAISVFPHLIQRIRHIRLFELCLATLNLVAKF